MNHHLTTIIPEKLECREQKEYSLFWYNLACCLLHLIQAIAVLALGLGNSKLSKFKLPLTSTFTVWPRGYPQQQLVVRGNLPFVAATSGFAFMSGEISFSVLCQFVSFLSFPLVNNQSNNKHFCYRLCPCSSTHWTLLLLFL